MSKILMSFAFIIVFTYSYFPSSDADVEKPFLLVEKNISQSKFSWTDTELVTIKIVNEGNAVAKNVHIVDHIPAGFVATNGNSTINEDTLSIDLPDLNAGKEQTTTYSLTGKVGMNGNVQISLQPTEVAYDDVIGNHYERKSNHVEITLESANWQENLVATVSFLVVLSFGFGYFGSVIHWATSNESSKKSTWKQSFLGGAAGIIVLGTFQGLSSLFSGGNLQVNLQNMTVLIGTCLASGFAPNAVIDKFTQQWKNKANEEENKRKNADQNAEEARTSAKQSNAAMEIAENAHSIKEEQVIELVERGKILKNVMDLLENENSIKDEKMVELMDVNHKLRTETEKLKHKKNINSRSSKRK